MNHETQRLGRFAGPGAAALAIIAATAFGQSPPNRAMTEVLVDGTVLVDGVPFRSWSEYFASDFAHQRGVRCGVMTSPVEPGAAPDKLGGGGPQDCSLTQTNPDPQYAPHITRYRIPVVVHVLMNSNLEGMLTMETIESQIVVMNEDFLALRGTNGADSTTIEIEFYLAQTDPDGNPTTGVTNTINDAWFNDTGNYWDTLAWDPIHYFNIYTNTASGLLGYVPDLPQEGIVGQNLDRVMINYEAFGRPSPLVNFDLGRTGTHEAGHYLGLYHPFHGCDTANCYLSGDRICDTNPQSTPNFFCSFGTTCGVDDSVGNFMDWVDDPCMSNFTFEQARRMRCTIQHWRSELFEDLGACEVTVDCNLNCIEDAQEIGSATAPDCNGNAIPDSCDIAAGMAVDCDLNTVPDSCEDCNGNGIGDVCEFSGVFTSDSPRFAPFGAAVEPTTHTFVAPPNPLGDVTFTFSVVGTLGATSDSITATLNGTQLGPSGQIFVNGIICPGSPDVEQVVISAAEFLSQTGGGDAIVGMHTFDYLDTDCAGNTSIAVSVSYDTAPAPGDTNGNLVPDVCELARGDSDLDGTVGILDFLAILATWGVCPGPPCPEDADLDGSVGITDFLNVLANWG